jgi:hypothetical protein
MKSEHQLVIQLLYDALTAKVIYTPEHGIGG